MAAPFLKERSEKQARNRVRAGPLQPRAVTITVLARAYLAKKRAEGKSNKEGFGCLKRRPVRVVLRELREPMTALTQSAASARP